MTGSDITIAGLLLVTSIALSFGFTMWRVARQAERAVEVESDRAGLSDAAWFDSARRVRVLQHELANEKTAHAQTKLDHEWTRLTLAVQAARHDLPLAKQVLDEGAAVLRSNVIPMRGGR